jgi:hypothetical protein
MTDGARRAPWAVAALLAPLSAATFAGTVAWAAPDRAATGSPAAPATTTTAQAPGDGVDERIRREAARVKRLRAEVAKLRDQVADREDSRGSATSRKPAAGTGTSSSRKPRTGPTSAPAPPKARKPAPPPVDVTTGAS